MHKMTVVYLTFNGGHLIDRTLPLILLSLNTAPIAGEIIVVDNGSTDGFDWTNYVSHNNLSVVKLPENKGFSGGNNEGYQWATGDWITFISNDVIVSSQYPWNYFSEQRNENVLYGGSIISGPAGWNEIDGIAYPYVEGYFACAHRNVWEKIRWDERYHPADCEDIDLSIQALENGIELKKAPSGLRHIGGATCNALGNRMNTTLQLKQVLDTKWREIWNSKK